MSSKEMYDGSNKRGNQKDKKLPSESGMYELNVIKMDFWNVKF